MSKNNCGGPIVKEWPGYFLRDDSAMRDDLPKDEREAYSLFREAPYGRVHVFCGNLEWATEKAEEEIKNEVS
jgi:hypothetical protein